MGETLYSKNTDIGRVYEWKGEEFISVTTAIKNGVAKPNLLGWAAKQVASIAVRDADTVYSESTEEHVGNILSAFDGVRQSASEIGNVVHALCERIVNGEDVQYDTLAEDVKPFIDAFNQFLADWSPAFLETEAFVASRKYGYAGTLDGIMSLDGQVYIMDIKTGRSLHPEVGLQLAAYARADFIGRASGEESELPAVHPDKGLVLHLRPGKYGLYSCRIDNTTFDMFLAALDMHHYETYGKHFILGPKLSKQEG